MRNVSYENRISDRFYFLSKPREISQVLLKRKWFKPNKKINLLAVAWVQFIVHDITLHDPKKYGEIVALPLAPRDPLGDYLMIPLTQREVGSTKSRPTYLNHTTHWVDASQLYGVSVQEANRFRSFKNGQMKLDEDSLIPIDKLGHILTPGYRNWWVGLSFLHHTM